MDTVSKSERSRIMEQVKGSGNMSTEIAFIGILSSEKLTGWRRNYPAYGKPDFVFPKQRLAIFLDGCFWHYCPKHCRLPSSNRKYWERKIARNAQRDRSVTRRLKAAGWKVIRFWEHDLRGGAAATRKINRMREFVQQSPAHLQNGTRERVPF